MDATHPMDERGLSYVSCTATSKQSGVRCRRRPIPGGAVCVMHGGKVPQVMRAAQERLRALQHPAVDTLAYLMDQCETDPATAYQAARHVLDRTMGKAVERVQQQVAGALVVRYEPEWDDDEDGSLDDRRR